MATSFLDDGNTEGGLGPLLACYFSPCFERDSGNIVTITIVGSLVDQYEAVMAGTSIVASLARSLVTSKAVQHDTAQHRTKQHITRSYSRCKTSSCGPSNNWPVGQVGFCGA